VEAVRAHPARRRVEARAHPPAGDPAARAAALERIAAIDRRLAWDACLNVRDLGGLPSANGTLKPGILVRASALGSLSEAGRAAMRAHGVRTVIDLRGPDEVEEVKSPYADGATYAHVHFVHGRTMGLHRAATSGTMADELGRLAAPGGGLGAAVRAIAEAEPGIVLHCLAGRDRTGFVVAVVLAAVGVPDDDIVADYVASDADLAEEYVRFKGLHPETAAEIDAAIEGRARTMRDVLTTLQLAFGGSAAYLRTAGATAADLDAIRAKLVA
jgi:hypothetical protein